LPIGAGAQEYLISRGISEESVTKFALGFAPDGWQALTQAAAKQGIGPELLSVSGLCKRREDGSLYDAYRNRLMFPIQDSLGRTIGFGGRTLGDDDAKYINSPQSALFDKSRCLYGLPHARDAFRQSSSAVVVEGYIDCLMAHQYGFGQTVATLGTALTNEHVQLLRRFVESVTVVFDSDEAGKRAADQALPLFVQGAVDVKLAVVREAKDPAELLQIQGANAFEASLTSAVGALELKWQQVMRQCRDDATGPRRRRAVEELLSLLAGSSEFGACDPIQRGLIVNQLGKLLGLASEEVNRQLRALSRRSASAPARTASAFKLGSASSRDSAGSAMRELIEVLLNEPSLFPEIAPVFEPLLCTDETLRQIAQAIVELHEEESGIDLVRLISRFESVEVSSQITDLQASGERKGNYQATVAGATNRLMRLAEQDRIEEMSFVLRSRELGELGQGEIATKSLERTDALRRMNHFAARKHVGTPTSAGVAIDGSNVAG
jgi:DNA primase